MFMQRVRQKGKMTFRVSPLANTIINFINSYFYLFKILKTITKQNYLLRMLSMKVQVNIFKKYKRTLNDS
jgi:hypothetical protein